LTGPLSASPRGDPREGSLQLIPEAAQSSEAEI